MPDELLPRTLVVNFNAPELNQLALALAQAGRLERYLRPYVNKGRGWERALATLPLAGNVYASTFGRRVMTDPALARLTREAGVLPDVLAATAMRLPLPDAWRRRWANELIMSLRESVAEAAARLAVEVPCLVAYEGFALPAFIARRAAGPGRTVLNYPVAHHRVRRRERLEEIARTPQFASTWPDFDDWPDGHEQRLDDEISLADAVLVGSTYAADTFVTQGIPRTRMRVVPYGVDLATFSPPAEGERARRDGARFEAIFTGQMTQRKGLSYLLEGWRRFARADARLTIVGQAVGDPRALAPHADLFRHVPHQSREALARHYRGADVFVFPTLVEGMPLVVLEAMACGLPVIVTANGPADIVRDGIDGFVIPTRDPDAIADRLERLYRDPALREEMGRNASRRAGQFGWSAYTDQVKACLAELCAPLRAGAPAFTAPFMPTGASPAP